ncbi:pimeloyl-ACP methyl ester carboxylesterase [Chitinophaga niastensis]|uniref:Pimeloyl-ACP methyl ester carboxylesterase n=1 Tax=Chitinophaga niastensis TaxID=536980 RepID=A0A2P8HUE1_CHINA|nr:alpha/beta hydrolase [Chitinophaga niastensis]PSL49836.1 pimeloyl-ACP methyl ester carboxylesterase [Chitinophaga niastensis]
MKTSSTQVLFKTVAINNLDIFYREAGPKDAPVILLLHGFPSSSHMYRDLITDLAGKYHVIAPDYPGFGLSSSPALTAFDYTFDNLAIIMEQFIDKLGLTKFTWYLQDYGGPIGFRIIGKRPELVRALIIQNANVYVEGLGPDVQRIGELQKAGDENALLAAIEHKLSLESIKGEHLFGAENEERVSPDSYQLAHFYVARPGIKEIQVALFQNYGTNFPKYPEWQQYLKTHQPPALIVWGKNDRIFTGPGGEAYKKDLKNAEVHLFNGGHFMLEEYHQPVAALIDDFLNRF